jgi:hypothetical protein
MVTGVVSGPWGYSPQSIAGMANNLSNRFTNQLSLTSIPPKMYNGEYVSPLTEANANWYTYTGFGRKKRRSNFGNVKNCSACNIYNREQCNVFLRSNRKIDPITGKNISPRSAAYKALSAQCLQYQLQAPVATVPMYIRKPSECNDNLYSRYSVNYNCSDRGVDKKLILNGKTYSRGSAAFYNEQKTPGGMITGMGCKQITILTANKIQKHITLENFFKFNF